MKTLQDIKKTYAQEQGYADWEQLDMLSGREEITKHIDEICIRAQKAALEKAAESLIWMQDIELQESITNEQNLIR